MPTLLFLSEERTEETPSDKNLVSRNENPPRRWREKLALSRSLGFQMLYSHAIGGDKLRRNTRRGEKPAGSTRRVTVWTPCESYRSDPDASSDVTTTRQNCESSHRETQAAAHQIQRRRHHADGHSRQSGGLRCSTKNCVRSAPPVSSVQ